jgi:hypothetical protein
MTERTEKVRSFFMQMNLPNHPPDDLPFLPNYPWDGLYSFREYPKDTLDKRRVFR